jgi:hypothetical protein
MEQYNNDRPHQALDMKYPGELYTPSARTYAEPPDPVYPFHDRTVRVTRCGRICLGKRKISLSHSFSDQLVGIQALATRSGSSALWNSTLATSTKTRQGSSRP